MSKPRQLGPFRLVATETGWEVHTAEPPIPGVEVRFPAYDGNSYGERLADAGFPGIPCGPPREGEVWFSQPDAASSAYEPTLILEAGAVHVKHTTSTGNHHTLLDEFTASHVRSLRDTRA